MTINLLRLRILKFFWKAKHWFENLFAKKKPEQPQSVTYTTEAPLPKLIKRGTSDLTKSGLKKHPPHKMAFGNFRSQRKFTTGGYKTLFVWEKNH